MIERFRKIAPNLYRGSAPSATDVQILKNKYNINKIVSLDEDSGKRIERACKLLDINQVIIHLDGTRKSLLELLKHNLKDLLIKGGPTFIHCLHGKDRTGFLAALYKCKYMGVSSEDAIKEAKSLGFGIGVDPQFIKLYEKIINNCKKTDDNNADIVSNQRDYKFDSRDSYLDEGHQGSFSPYLSQTRQYPYDNIYNPINDQSPTRQNYNKEPIKEQFDLNEKIPMVGTYDNGAGLYGAGPVFPAGGFINS